MIRKGQVSLGILAGGRATRLGGIDKAFAVHEGEPLLVRSLRLAGDGFREVLVSYNGSDPRVPNLGVRIASDLRLHRPGPLAGIEALLSACTGDWLLSLPVDLRALPENVFLQMAAVAGAAGANQGVCLGDADGEQPLVSLWPVARSLARVMESLDEGNLAARHLVRGMGFARCDISPFRIGNLNSPADFG